MSEWAKKCELTLQEILEQIIARFIQTFLFKNGEINFYFFKFYPDIFLKKLAK